MTLKEARKKMGLTQYELAEKCGMIQPEISRVERDPERSTLRMLKRIAKGLGMRLRIEFELCD